MMHLWRAFTRVPLRRSHIPTSCPPLPSSPSLPSIPLFSGQSPHVLRYSGRYVDREGNVHFRRPTSNLWQPKRKDGGESNSWGKKGGPNETWWERHRNTVVISVAGAGIVGITYTSHLERVPYTMRSHCILISTAYENALGEEAFKEVKASKLLSTLPAHHPSAIRVCKIAADIIGALDDIDSQQGLSIGPPKSAPVKYSAPDKSSLATSAAADSPLPAGSKKEDPDSWDADQKEDLPMSSSSHGSSDWVENQKLGEEDKWVEKNRKYAYNTDKRGFTAHLKDLTWEVIVVNEPVVNAFCIPGGKIVVFTGLLDLLPSDAEVATVLGHEVGHVIARHGMERMTASIALIIFQIIVLQFVNMPNLVGSVSDLLFTKPFSRMHEIEADRIGLMLMASAGYDPRSAPEVYTKIDKENESSKWIEFVSTHPSGRRRAELLTKASTMAEASKIYEEKLQEKDVNSSFSLSSVYWS